MPRGGRIVNISSVASKLGMDILPVYGASKAALDSLSFSWAKEVCVFFSAYLYFHSLLYRV
jgi:NAD(P)-dependent dehydrogenase (short-subunit alcohol dehydrogenase family)